MTATDQRVDAETWHLWRSAGITATDVASAYTGSFGGAYGVVASKLGLVEPPVFNDRMRRGLAWEERIADLVHIATGLWVHGEQLLCENADQPLHRATIDGLLAPAAETTMDDVVAVLEVKTSGIEVRAPWPRWEAQVQWQLHCTGLDRALIAKATIDDSDDTLTNLTLRWVERDDFLIGHLVDLAEQMWAHVEAGTLPDPDAPSALDLVKEVTAIADVDALPVDLSDIADDVARLVEIKAAMKTVKAEHDRLDALVRSRLGHATKGTTEGVTVTYSRNQSVRTPEGNAAFLAAHPELAKPVEIDTKRAERDAPDDYAAIPREPIGSRSLTIKESRS